MASLDTRPATPDRLMSLRRSGALPEAAFARGIVLACGSPEPVAWRRFLDWLLLGLGAALVLAGVVFFVAFNWSQLGHFAKLGLAGALVCGAAVGAHRLGLEGLPGKIALTAAAVLIGPLLAIFGQTYQTGADPYQLFLGWLVLIGLWVAISKFPPLWLIALLLINVTLSLYWSQVLEADLRWEPEREYVLLLVLVGVNSAAWIGWEILQLRGAEGVTGRWLPRLLASVCLGGLSFQSLSLMLDYRHHDVDGVQWVMAAMLVVLVVGTLAFFLTLQRDLFMLAVAGGAVMTILTTLLGKVLLSGTSSDAAILPVFFLGLLVIGEVGAAAWWLRGLHRRWEASPQ